MRHYRLLCHRAASWVAVLALGCNLSAPAGAQIRAVTPDELDAVPAGHQDIARGLGPVGGNKSGKNSRDPGAAGPGGPEQPPTLSSNADPHDLRGTWSGGFRTEDSFPRRERPGPQVRSRYELALLCLAPPGVMPSGGQIFQNDRLITWVTNNDLRVRRIYLNRSHPVALKPTYGGHSVGHWEGDTLVVDTVALQGTFGYFGDSNHQPGKDIYDQPTTVKGQKLPPPTQYFKNVVVMATPTLHVVERIRKINHNRQLEDLLSFDDAATGMTPYSVQVRYNYAHPGEYLEQICEDGNDLFGPQYAEHAIGGTP